MISENSSVPAAPQYLHDQLELYDVQMESNHFDIQQQHHIQVKNISSSVDSRDHSHAFNFEEAQSSRRSPNQFDSSEMIRNGSASAQHQSHSNYHSQQSSLSQQHNQLQFNKQPTTSQSPSKRLLKMKITSSYIINQATPVNITPSQLKYIPTNSYNSNVNQNQMNVVADQSSDFWNDRIISSTAASTRRKESVQPAGLLSAAEDLSSTTKYYQKLQYHQAQVVPQISNPAADLQILQLETPVGNNDSYVRQKDQNITPIQHQSYNFHHKYQLQPTNSSRNRDLPVKTPSVGRMVPIKQIISENEHRHQIQGVQPNDEFTSNTMTNIEQQKQLPRQPTTQSRKSSMPNVLSSAQRKIEQQEPQRTNRMKSRDPTPPQIHRKHAQSQINHSSGKNLSNQMIDQQQQPPPSTSSTKKSYLYLNKNSPLSHLLNKGVKQQQQQQQQQNEQIEQNSEVNNNNDSSSSNCVDQIQAQENFEEFHFLQVEFHQKCKHWMRKLENSKFLLN